MWPLIVKRKENPAIQISDVICILKWLLVCKENRCGFNNDGENT